MKEQTTKYVEKILRVLEDYPDILLCSIYGSAASSKLTEHSDIDIAVAGNTPIPGETLAELSIKLSDACRREVDLVDLQANSGVLLREVLCEGRVILKKSTQLYAALIRKMWYNQADVMPNVRMIWRARREKISEARI